MVSTELDLVSTEELEDRVSTELDPVSTEELLDLVSTLLDELEAGRTQQHSPNSLPS